MTNRTSALLDDNAPASDQADDVDEEAGKLKDEKSRGKKNPSSDNEHKNRDTDESSLVYLFTHTISLQSHLFSDSYAMF